MKSWRGLRFAGLMMVLLIMASWPACDSGDGGDSGGGDSDGDSDGDGDGDADSDADADGDTDSDADADGDADGDCDESGDGQVPVPPDWAVRECEVLKIVNQHRTTGYDCPEGSFDATDPVTMNGSLRDAARCHSQDMADNNYFDHTAQDGDACGGGGTRFTDRCKNFGYIGGLGGENIAGGNSSAEATMNQWMGSSSGHCGNIMNPRWKHIGIGYGNNDSGRLRHYWTQNFGSN